MFQLAERLATRVATTIQRPDTLLGPQFALTADDHRISTVLLWQVGTEPGPERRIFDTLRCCLRDHRRRAALILYALHHPSIGIPGDLMIRIQAYG